MSLMEKTENHVLTIEVDADCLSDQHVQKFKDALVSLEGKTTVLLDCPGANSISETAMKALSELSGNLSEKGISFIMIANKTLVEQLDRTPLEKSVRSIVEFNRLQIVADSLKGPQGINSLVETLSAAVLQVVNNYAQASAVIGSESARDQHKNTKIEIAGTIDFSTQDCSGRMILSFPLDTFLTLTSKIMGENYTVIRSEIRDWSGELINMISSSAKESLNKRGYHVSLTLPSVLVAEDVNNLRARSMNNVTVPFEIEQKTFFLEIFMDVEKSNKQ